MDGSIPVSPLETRRFLERKAAARGKRLLERNSRATADFLAIIEMIARDYAPLRIWQWGSLLEPERFSEISDIDIALEDFAGDSAAWFELLGKAEELSDFPLDIIRLERIEPLHAASIRERGRIAYERP